MRAVITGASRGIGHAAARLLMSKGYEVIALARTPCADVEITPCDVTKEEEIRRVFSSIESIDLLVLNAGAESFGQVQDVTRTEYTRVTDTNLGGVIFAAKYGVGKMLSRGGAIVTVASVWGETGASCESLYAATKGGVIAFTKSLAKELAPSAVTVNCVSPGVIDTAMNARLSPEERKALESEIPLGRFGTAEEVARAILFFAENRYITGQVLGVNGGFLI